MMCVYVVDLAVCSHLVAVCAVRFEKPVSCTCGDITQVLTCLAAPILSFSPECPVDHCDYLPALVWAFLFVQFPDLFSKLLSPNDMPVSSWNLWTVFAKMIELLPVVICDVASETARRPPGIPGVNARSSPLFLLLLWFFQTIFFFVTYGLFLPTELFHSAESTELPVFFSLITTCWISSLFPSVVFELYPNTRDT